MLSDSSIINILTLRYDPSISPNLPKKTWNDFQSIDKSVNIDLIEKLIVNNNKIIFFLFIILMKFKFLYFFYK